MDIVSDEQLLALDKDGIIPGPGELPADFLARARFCLGLKERLLSDMEGAFPFSQKDLENREVVEDVFLITRPLYGIAPRWIPLFFSNYKLLPWHGEQLGFFNWKKMGLLRP